MQTFLPYPLFAMTAECLDNKRLGKQRIEAKQIYDILTKGEKSKSWAWHHHPSVKMWEGYEDALAFYYNCIRYEWIGRGFKNTMPEIKVKLSKNGNSQYLKVPSWLGDEKFHASHRSNLKRKNPSFYGKYNWAESPDLPYIWPKEEI